jgi:hypothetical protein
MLENHCSNDAGDRLRVCSTACCHELEEEGELCIRKIEGDELSFSTGTSPNFSTGVKATETSEKRSADARYQYTQKNPRAVQYILSSTILEASHPLDPLRLEKLGLLASARGGKRHMRIGS